MNDTPRADTNGVVATIHRDGYWTNKMPEQDPFPYLSQHGPIEVCLASELADALDERDMLRLHIADKNADISTMGATRVRLEKELAAALEELARLNAAWKAQQFHLEHEEKESEFQELRAERAEAALAECRARLEIDFATDGNGKRVPLPAGAPDGIACRDETIRLLEAALAESERKCERLKFHAEAMREILLAQLVNQGSHLYEWREETEVALASHRAEFKEDKP